jgi:hypothetical protein
VPGFGPTTWRGVNQLSIYGRHKWEFGAETMLWLGLPEDDRLAGDESLGDYFVGARADVPLSPYWSLYTLVTYMHPSASAGPAGAVEEQWNFTVGMSLDLGARARTATIVGDRWAPLLPVASNGYFLVDASQWY